MHLKCLNLFSNQKSFSRRMTKPIKWHVHPAKTQISLGIRPVCSESSVCDQRVAKDPRFLHMLSKDPDQTERMPRLIRVFAGHTLFCWFCRVAAHLHFLLIHLDITCTRNKEKNQWCIISRTRLTGQQRRLHIRYCKNPKNSDTKTTCGNRPKISTMWLYHGVMHPKYADRMENSADPDQTAPSDLGLHCLLWPVCLKT